MVNRKFFAHSILKHANISKIIMLDRFVFSDESRFCLNNDGELIWYRKNEITDEIFKEKAKFNLGIMLYGAIGVGYKSPLIICENNIDEVEYRKIINESKIFEELNEKYDSPGNFIFVQDGAGAPAHTSFLTGLFFKKRGKFIKNGQQIAQI